jgi:hypothetical protein
MRTVYGSLPFYDSLEKQDVERTKAIIPIHCPRTQLPPFLIALGSESVVTVTSVRLVNKDATTYPVTAWTNIDYETCIITANSISAIETVGTGTVMSNYFACIRGKIITVTFNLAITLGEAPTVYLARVGTGSIASQLATPGANSITFIADVDATQYYVMFFNTNAANWQATSISVAHEPEIDITSFFVDIPEIYTPTDTDYDPYIKYNGDTLKYLLPLGAYYVKIANGEIEYYSDWIMIQNIYTNLITSFINDTYETWISSGNIVNSAIETGISGWASSGNTFTVIKGESIRVIFYATLNSGVLPKVSLGIIGVGQISTAEIQIVAGINDVTLVSNTYTSICSLALWNYAAGNWFTSEVLVTRARSSHFIQIAFKNSKNFGDLIYEDSFEQKVWLDAILNDPSHETVSIGEEKDGVFIAEKLISKLIYSVIAYVSQGLYKCLMRLPLHDTIEITDEVGNTYTPDVGNVIIEQPEWPGIETSKVTIKFNDGENSAFTWTK